MAGNGFHIAGDPGRYMRGGPRRIPFSRVWYIAAAVLLLALIAGGIYVCASEPANEDDIEASLKQFLEATSRGDYATAYERQSPALQREIFESFKARTSSDLRYSSFARLERVDIGLEGPRSQSYIYEGRVIYADGTERPVHAFLTPMGGKWLIDSIEIE